MTRRYRGRELDPDQLRHVHGATGILLPALGQARERIRDAAEPLAADGIYLSFGSIKGDATE